MGQLNILIITKWYPSEAHPKSGVFVEELAKALSAQHQVTVLFAYPSPRPLKGFYEVQIEETPGLKVVRVRYRDWFPLPGILETALFNWWIKRIYKKVLAPTYRPDIINAHVYRSAPSALAIGKLTGAPVLLSEHSLELLDHQELTPEFKLFAQHYLPKFLRILPVSNALKKELEQFAPQVNITVVPNVVDTNIFYPAPAHDRPATQLKRILTVSLLMPVKGVAELLKAICRLKAKRQDFILDIVGDGIGRKALEDMVTEYQLERFVKFHGLKSKQEIAQFMRECAFFTLPSWMETFGVVFIEAMACGKPIVATRVGNIPALVNEERGLLVPPKDPVALEGALNKMLDSHTTYSSAKIAQYAKDHFSYPAVVAQLDQIFQEVLRK
ncbi:MAG: glycosyltransferase [Candidatus Margulisbacteria bacterium]|nr:glycosyltransferase [Candidatus Margulisiibacteriota bacterium]